MSTTDMSFLFAFLPLSLCACLAGAKVQKYILLIFSLFFYACGSPKYFILFIGMVIVNIGLSYIIQACNKRKKVFEVGRIISLIVGILLNVGVLFYYKYFDFAITNINSVFGMNFATKNLLLPLGISFFTFKAISLLVDVYKGKVVLKGNPCYAALYLSFFGQVVSGPISRYGEFYEKYDDESLNNNKFERFSEGSYLFVKGFCKKVLIANVLSPVVVEIFSMEMRDTSAALLWLGSIAFSMQLYYDFSGYSDMAIGIGKMYGINCNENFNHPYCTRSISEFWRRWHISLGTWFKEYIYFPMGGSRVKSKIRLFFNLLVVWLCTGIWHGASWAFVFWGLAYFVVIAIEKATKMPERLKSNLAKIIYRVFCLMFINFQWVIFNSVSLKTGLNYIKHMFVSAGNELANIRTVVLLQQYGIFIVVAIIFSAPVISKIKELTEKKIKKFRFVVGAVEAIVLMLLFICAMSFVIAGQNNPFLYGNF